MAMNTIRLRRVATMLAASVFCCAAHAQYVWLNEQGVKQFSDMPPPASVPKSRVLKSPGGDLPSRFAAGGTPKDRESRDSAATAPASEKAPMSLAEKNAEFQKRRMEQATREKKAADEERLASEKAKNCDQARSYQQALLSGERIARRDKNGERSFMTDEQREQETREAQRILADCK
jgi:hypothetical protein